jgi:endonuclease/exonuclease/phosphatase family metal-dependent hydrolase
MGDGPNEASGHNHGDEHVCIVTWNTGAFGEGTQGELKAAAVEDCFIGSNADIVMLQEVIGRK